MKKEDLKFYPKHPSDEKTHQIENTAMPLLEQDTPFDVKMLCDEFSTDADSFFSNYTDKRFEVTGIVKKLNSGANQKWSLELSDSINGQTYAIAIFPSSESYHDAKVGDTVVVRANYLVMSDYYGIVMKFSKLISVTNN